MIEVGLQELRSKWVTEIEIDRYLNWWLINRVIEIELAGDHLVDKRYKLKRYYI